MLDVFMMLHLWCFGVVCTCITFRDIQGDFVFVY